MGARGGQTRRSRVGAIHPPKQRPTAATYTNKRNQAIAQECSGKATQRLNLNDDTCYQAPATATHTPGSFSPHRAK